MVSTLLQLISLVHKSLFTTKEQLKVTAGLFALIFLTIPISGKSVSTIPLTCSRTGIVEKQNEIKHTVERTMLYTNQAKTNLKTKDAFITAYTSEEAQTDSTPFLTASNTEVRDGIVAANFLPFGTRMKIEGFGNKVFIVEDRMHPRFSNYVDIWMNSKEEAIKFGVQKKKIVILD